MVRKIEQVINHKNWKKITDILFPILLICFSYIHINEGITITDTGYNYGNFVFFDGLDDMWKFSTYLASVTGAFFTHLPFGKTMIGLNFYTGILKILSALSVYFFCIRICKMRKEAVFLGEMLALGLCWCPTALIYNYLTYFFFHMGAICLFVAVTKQKNTFYVFAGIFLGLNLLVRLPNAAEIALILVVWFSGFLYKKKIGIVMKETGFCVLGYVLGAGSVFVYILCRYGITRYMDGISALFSMTQEAESYTITAMIFDTLRTYVQYIKWIILGIVLCFAGVALFQIGKEKYHKIKGGICLLGSLSFIYILKRNGVFTLNYRWYDSIYGIGVLFLIVVLLYCGWILLSKNRKREEKVLASIVCVIVLITPLGSNNNVYSPMNNLFLAAPFFLNQLWELLFCKKSSMMVRKVSISYVPFQMLFSIFSGVLLIQSFFFGASFVFRDGVNGEERNYKITDNVALNGMYTTEENGQNLQELNSYLVENNLIGSEAILFGNVPAYAFYFELNPVISSTWPDLQSYSVQKFKEEIEKLDTKDSNPIILMSANPIDTGADDTCKEFLKEKYKYLTEYMENHQYEQVFSNEICILYRSE